jgi:malate synthase
MQEKYININKLKVSESLSRFVKDELLKDTNISSDDFWLGFEKTIEELEPKNRQLINFRETLQKKIDAWHIKNKSNEFNLIEYKKFLVEIGYFKRRRRRFFNRHKKCRR